VYQVLVLSGFANCLEAEPSFGFGRFSQYYKGVLGFGFPGFTKSEKVKVLPGFDNTGKG
jgi:hypothetical protein